MLNGESGRRTQAYDAAIGDADVAPLGIDSAADYLFNNKKENSRSGYKSK